MNPEKINTPYKKAAAVFCGLRNEREYIQDLLTQAEEIETLIIKVGSSLGNTGGSSSSGSGNDMSRIKGIHRLDEVRQRMIEKVNEYGSLRAEVSAAIMQMKGPSEKRALLLYYFPKTLKGDHEPLFRTWDEVAEIMHCDVRTAQNYRDKGFEAFAKIYFKNEQ